MKVFRWYESIIWRLFGYMMKRHGYYYMDGIAGNNGRGVTAIIFSSVPIEREYTSESFPNPS